MKEKYVKILLVIILIPDSCFDKNNAFMQCWYPGAKGGKAVADILFGLDSPSGRLPVTFYLSDKDLPDISNYSMHERTYRYFTKEVMYPFGYGLSYTKFEYGNMDYAVDKDTIKLKITVKNSGNFMAEEVVQTYIKHIGLTVLTPRWALKKINRIKIEKNSSVDMVINFDRKELTYINDDGDAIINDKSIQFFIGGSSPDDAFFNGQSVIIDMNN